MDYEAPLLWEIEGPDGKSVGRVRWAGEMSVEVDADPSRAAYLEECASKVFMLAAAAGGDSYLVGSLLDKLMREQLVRASDGAMRGVRIADPTAETEEEKLARVGLPKDISPASLIEATRAGRLVWTTSEDGKGFWAGADPASGDSCLMIGRAGKQFTLLLSRQQTIGLPTQQKNGFFGGKCELAKLYDAIEASKPGSASARGGPGKTNGSPAQWAPAGSSPAVLDDPLTEPRFREHLANGKVIERARYGGYVLVAVDTSGAPAGAMRYRYRIFVLPSEGATPVLAVNHEISAFGTACFGVHRGAAHVNYDSAEATLSYDDFVTRAKAILGEELLGIPVPR